MSEKLTVLGKEYEFEFRQTVLVSGKGDPQNVWIASMLKSNNPFNINLNGIGVDKSDAMVKLHATIYQYLKIMEQEKISEENKN